MVTITIGFISSGYSYAELKTDIKTCDFKWLWVGLNLDRLL